MNHFMRFFMVFLAVLLLIPATFTVASDNEEQAKNSVYDTLAASKNETREAYDMLLSDNISGDIEVSQYASVFWDVIFYIHQILKAVYFVVMTLLFIAALLVAILLKKNKAGQKRIIVICITLAVFMTFYVIFLPYLYTSFYA